MRAIYLDENFYRENWSETVVEILQNLKFIAQQKLPLSTRLHKTTTQILQSSTSVDDAKIIWIQGDYYEFMQKSYDVRTTSYEGFSQHNSWLTYENLDSVVIYYSMLYSISSK